MAIECFEIKWTKQYPFEKALTQPEANEGGVYALYRAKGNTKNLHYIGKSKEFASRFSTHKRNTSHMMTESELKRCYVSFGMISSFETSRLTPSTNPDHLKVVENFLLVKLDPTGNHSNTKRRYIGDYPIIIANTGKFTKPFRKLMSQSDDLIKMLTGTTKNKTTSADSWPF